jgi:hypothetical protein
MTGLEAVLAALILAWFALLSSSAVQMVRARSPDEHEQAERTLTASLLAGVIIAVAPSVAEWVTGYSYSDGQYCADGTCLPKDVSETVHKIVQGLRALGGAIMILGLVWGGIQMRRRRKSSEIQTGGGLNRICASQRFR